MMNKLQTLVGEDVFPNPDNIGDSQYRAIYETLDGAMEDCEPADREALIRTILGEFKEWSESLLRRMGTRVCLDRDELNAVLANKADAAAETNPKNSEGQTTASASRSTFPPGMRWRLRKKPTVCCDCTIALRGFVKCLQGRTRRKLRWSST